MNKQTIAITSEQVLAKEMEVIRLSMEHNRCVRNGDVLKAAEIMAEITDGISEYNADSLEFALSECADFSAAVRRFSYPVLRTGKMREDVEGCIAINTATAPMPLESVLIHFDKQEHLRPIRRFMMRLFVEQAIGMGCTNASSKKATEELAMVCGVFREWDDFNNKINGAKDPFSNSRKKEVLQPIVKDLLDKNVTSKYIKYLEIGSVKLGGKRLTITPQREETFNRAFWNVLYGFETEAPIKIEM